MANQNNWNIAQMRKSGPIEAGCVGGTQPSVPAKQWVISSFGRASVLHAEGGWFEPSMTHQLCFELCVIYKYVYINNSSIYYEKGRI